MCHPWHISHYKESPSWADLIFTFFLLIGARWKQLLGTSTHPFYPSIFFQGGNDVYTLRYKASLHPHVPSQLPIYHRHAHKYTHWHCSSFTTGECKLSRNSAEGRQITGYLLAFCLPCWDLICCVTFAVIYSSSAEPSACFSLFS